MSDTSKPRKTVDLVSPEEFDDVMQRTAAALRNAEAFRAANAAFFPPKADPQPFEPEPSDRAWAAEAFAPCPAARYVFSPETAEKLAGPNLP